MAGSSVVATRRGEEVEDEEEEEEEEGRTALKRAERTASERIVGSATALLGSSVLSGKSES